MPFIRGGIQLERHRFCTCAQKPELLRLDRLVNILCGADDGDCTHEIAVEIRDRGGDCGDAEHGFIHRHFVELPTDLVEAPPQDGLFRNLAFTCRGLANIGVAEAELARFPQEFREGMEERAGLLGERKSASVLIHAAAGGVGTAAVQMGKILGITTLGTSSSAEKLVRAKELGLTHGINYKVEDYETRVAEITNGRWDLRSVVPLTLGAFAVRQMLTDFAVVGTIPWYVLAWYAFDSFWKLNQAQEDPARIHDRAPDADGE